MGASGFRKALNSDRTFWHLVRSDWNPSLSDGNFSLSVQIHHTHPHILHEVTPILWIYPPHDFRGKEIASPPHAAHFQDCYR